MSRFPPLEAAEMEEASSITPQAAKARALKEI
jgi:hypothetical protein